MKKKVLTFLKNFYSYGGSYECIGLILMIFFFNLWDNFLILIFYFIFIKENLKTCEIDLSYFKMKRSGGDSKPKKDKNPESNKTQDDKTQDSDKSSDKTQSKDNKGSDQSPENPHIKPTTVEWGYSAADYVSDAVTLPPVKGVKQVSEKANFDATKDLQNKAEKLKGLEDHNKATSEKLTQVQGENALSEIHNKEVSKTLDTKIEACIIQNCDKQPMSAEDAAFFKQNIQPVIDRKRSEQEKSQTPDSDDSSGGFFGWWW